MLLCCALSEYELISKNDKIENYIDRLASKDIDAMDSLYSLIKTDVYAFALSKTQNPHDAEDILQDTFVQIFRYADRYEAKGKPLAWIFTIVTNLANRKFQISQRTVAYEDEFDDTVSDGKEFENDIVTNNFLRELMNILSKEEQEIIVLHIVSGLKHIEIAQILRKPLSTVLSRYNRAIKKMQNYEEEAV